MLIVSSLEPAHLCILQLKTRNSDACYAHTYINIYTMDNKQRAHFYATGQTDNDLLNNKGSIRSTSLNVNGIGTFIGLSWPIASHIIHIVHNSWW